ncbi:MAG: hypothetical protein WCP21_19775, partial [Armatimonadota bacterium]
DQVKLGFGDRVATLAWNGYRHLELYFGVSGSGRILVPINFRLVAEEVRCWPLQLTPGAYYQ